MANKYTIEYKVQAVKLAQEVGTPKAAAELGISANTIYGWVAQARSGDLDLGPGSRTPEVSMSLAEEVKILRQQVKQQEKEIKRLNELNEFLEEASAFFAANRRRSPK